MAPVDSEFVYYLSFCSSPLSHPRDAIQQLKDLTQDKFGAQCRQNAHKASHIVIRQQAVVTPRLQVIIQVVKAVLTVYLIVDGESAVFVADPLFGFGFDEDLENVDEEAGVDDGGVVGEDFLVEGGEGAGLFLLGAASRFGGLLSALHGLAAWVY